MLPFFDPMGINNYTGKPSNGKGLSLCSFMVVKSKGYVTAQCITDYIMYHDTPGRELEHVLNHGILVVVMLLMLWIK
jgi:hypothetical protein